MSVEFREAGPPGTPPPVVPDSGPAEYRTVRLILANGMDLPYRVHVNYPLMIPQNHLAHFQAAIANAGGIVGLLVTSPEVFP